jgi:hypothetical protein
VLPLNTSTNDTYRALRVSKSHGHHDGRTRCHLRISVPPVERAVVVHESSLLLLSLSVVFRSGSPLVHSRTRSLRLVITRRIAVVPAAAGRPGQSNQDALAAWGCTCSGVPRAS